MTKQRPPDHVVTGRSEGAAWKQFARQLAWVLAQLTDGHYLILDVQGAPHFVQFAGKREGGLRMETTSNVFLPQAAQLDAHQIAALLGLGWQPPDALPGGTDPPREPDLSPPCVPNFFVDAHSPMMLDLVAARAVQTFTDIWRVRHPRCLRYTAIDEHGAARLLPQLGLQRAPQPCAPQDAEACLLAALIEVTGIPGLVCEENGVIGMLYQAMQTCVRLVDLERYVRIETPILEGVAEAGRLYRRLNTLNMASMLLRYVYLDGVIYAVMDLPAAPLTPALLHAVLGKFWHDVADMDAQLQPDCGGTSMFIRETPLSVH